MVTRRTLASAVLTVLVCSLCPRPAAASVPDLFGFGARGAAMAGALTATVAAEEAVYYNPAGLAFAEHASFTVGYQLADFSLQIDGRPVALPAAPAMLLGFDVPLPFRGPLAHRLTIGFGFVLPESAVLVADLPQPVAPRFVRIERRAETVSLMGGLGARIFDRLAIGAGFIALAALNGAIEVAPNDAHKIGSQVRDALVADYALIAGVVARPLDDLSVGLVYHGESVAHFSLPIRADLGSQFPIVIPPLNITGAAQFDPRQVALGAAWSATPDLLFAATAVYEAWSRFENPVEFTAVPSTYPAQPAPDFSDVVALRAGVEGHLDLGAWQVRPRGGLAVEPSPVPEQKGFHNYLDNTRLVFSAGAGVTWRSFTLDLAGAWHYLPERTDVKDPTLVAQIPPLYVGAGAPVGTTGTKISHGGSLFSLTAALGVRL